jgi:hypothetical protein
MAVAGVVPGLFTDDPAVIERAEEIWPLFALMQPAAAVVFALDGILIGAGRHAVPRGVDGRRRASAPTSRSRSPRWRSTGASSACGAASSA